MARQPAQRVAIEQLLRQEYVVILLPGIIGSDEVRVVELPGRLDLAEEM